ncbi:hypothetical protein [Sphingomonas sp. PAMC 26605]|uniref:hypothetical protein n=1 Tax=Sphingomonas sp. PAMC 26605 TaxID=1112214 RepID=UPI0005631F4F|nr:hypothetical protein [Sphingomonas sp. PAMC 26605]
MTGDDYPIKLMLAFDFADGSVFVGETSEPKRFIRAVMREWQSDERPVVRVVSSYRELVNQSRGYDIHSKYVARYGAMLAGKGIRARGLGADGLPRTYAGSDLEFHADVISAAGSIAWGGGDPLVIDGITSMPANLEKPAGPANAAAMRPIGLAIVVGGVGLALGAVAMRRRKLSGFHTPGAVKR